MTEAKTVGPGTVLAGRYELADVIGHGGFGTVYRARQINMDREVAVKILPPQFLEINDVVERFKREAMLASRLRHPNTITLHDYGQHENLLYIVMELLLGEDLADLLKREGRLPPERIMHIARQVLKSLAEAHEQHIVHRDLKPENIFLSVVGDERDHVKVLDFGIAKLALPTSGEDDNGRRLTLSGSTVGTPTYMSPEQAAGEEVDGTTDLYALGIMMYEMACGRPPFHHKDPVKVMRAQLFEAVPPLRDPKLLGTVLDRVIQKALAKDRDQRFATANEMLLALAGEPVARPRIQGIAFNSLDEPSTEEMRLDERHGPNTDDYDFPGEEGDAAAKPSTLAYTKAVGKDRVDDSVPFSSVRTSTSPGGITAPQASDFAPAADTSTSSILTILEPSHAEDDVILLTRKKDGAQSSDSHEAQSRDASSAEVAAIEHEARLTPRPRSPNSSSDWESQEILDESPPPKATAEPRRPAMWWLLVLVAIAVVFAAMYYREISAAFSR